MGDYKFWRGNWELPIFGTEPNVAYIHAKAVSGLKV
jgi:hypothetical protein